MSKFKKKEFYLQGLDESFVGFTKNNTWNGFECPYFTKEIAKKIVKAYEKEEYNGDEHNAYYNKEEDTFVFDADYYDLEVFKGTTIEVGSEEKKVYPIGNGCWTWRLD